MSQLWFVICYYMIFFLLLGSLVVSVLLGVDCWLIMNKLTHTEIKPYWCIVPRPQHFISCIFVPVKHCHQSPLHDVSLKRAYIWFFSSNWGRSGCGRVWKSHASSVQSAPQSSVIHFFPRHHPASLWPAALLYSGLVRWDTMEVVSGRGQYISWTLIGRLTFKMLPSGMGQRTSKGERRREIRLWAIRLMK